MSVDQTGGCACGAVRYQLTEKPAFSIICQCRQCQRITGTGHAASFAVKAETVSIQGEVKYYEQTADSGNIGSSGFCPNCGSPLMKKTTGYPQYLMLHAVSLDDPSLYQPEMVVYSQFGWDWDYLDPDLPRK